MKKVCILLALLRHKYILWAECGVLFVKFNVSFGNRCVLGGSYCSSIRTFPSFIKPVYITVFPLSFVPKVCHFSAVTHNGIFPTDAVLLYSILSEYPLIFRSEVMFHVKCVRAGEGKLHCGSSDDSLRYWLSNNFSRVVVIRLVNNLQSWVRNIAWRIEKHMFTALIHGVCQKASTHKARALFRAVVCWNMPPDKAVILKTYSLWLIYDIVIIQHIWFYWVVAYFTDGAVLRKKIRNIIQGT